MAETTHNTGTEVPKGEHGGFPPFNSHTFPSQLIWLVIFFVLLFVLMARFALPRVRSAIEGREKHIAGDLAAAQKAKTESEEALAAYEKALADARARAQAIANETREKQSAEAEQARKVLEDQLNGRMAEAESVIKANKTAAMTNVSGIAADTAKAIVAQLIGTAPSDQATADAVAGVLKR